MKTLIRDHSRSGRDDIDRRVVFTKVETEGTTGEVAVLDERLLIELDLTTEADCAEGEQYADVRDEPPVDFAVPRPRCKQHKALEEEGKVHAFQEEWSDELLFQDA